MIIIDGGVEMKTAYVILDKERDENLWVELDGGAVFYVSSEIYATMHESIEDAMEVRDTLCFAYCDYIWCNHEDEDIRKKADKYLPENFHWDIDEEVVDGSILSGPFVVKKITYEIEDV
jgi:hypothetical protein